MAFREDDFGTETVALATPVVPAASASVAGLRTWAGFIAMSFGMLLAILDTQIVASSLPDIQVGLHLGLDQLSWVQTVYLIAEVVAIPLTGWLTRVMSTRGAFLLGIAGFTLASIACALATDFATFIPARIVQGFCGGLLIPLVFSAIFLMFPDALRMRATVIAGVMAMLAPTLGPTVGGFITDSYSWHWLFLINVVPGIAVALLVAWAVRIDRPDWSSLGSVDLLALPLLAIFLASLQIVLKEAPERGWDDRAMVVLIAFCALSGTALVRRCLRHPRPLIDLSVFGDRNFAFGCWFSFVLGIALYGATYLLPVFLGVIRYHEAFDIGLIMMVTGGTQLTVAPVAAVLARRMDARLLIAGGFALFALGLFGNGFMTYQSDFWELVWQQIARGAAMMLCLLPMTALALGEIDLPRVPNASGLFNLMRNLGGALGLALIDTVMERRAPEHIARLVDRLQAGDAAAARFVGLPTDRFTGVPIGSVDQATQNFVAPLVKRAGLVEAFNDAWIFVGAIVVLSLLLLPLLRQTRPGVVPGGS
jgi:MFS transporter, DHA2 family, multidrug resistance protein